MEETEIIHQMETIAEKTMETLAKTCKTKYMVDVPIGHYAEKLVKQWEKYEKIIILVDWDDTLRSHSVNNQQVCNSVCETIVEAQKLGAIVKLWTCRRHEDIASMVTDLELAYGITFYEINPTTPFKDNYSTKPYCNILLDDKAGLEQSLATLKLAIEIYGTAKTVKLNESLGTDRGDNER